MTTIGTDRNCIDYELAQHAHALKTRVTPIEWALFTEHCAGLDPYALDAEVCKYLRELDAPSDITESDEYQAWLAACQDTDFMLSERRPETSAAYTREIDAARKLVEYFQRIA